MTVTETDAGSRLRRRSLGGIGSLHPLHWAVIGLSLLVTAGAWWLSRGLVAERNATRFDREATQLVELVAERMGRYEDALRAGVAMIGARGGEVDRASWRAFAESLRVEERYPGLLGVGVVRRTDTAGLAALIERERESYPDFRVHPPVEGDEHFPIVYIEPQAVNEPAVGLDLAFEEHRLEGARRARYTGLARVTGPIVLVQDEKSTPGFLFYVPVNGVRPTGEPTANPIGGFDGHVYSPIIVEALMEAVLPGARRVNVSISDDGESIHDEHDPEHPAHDAAPLFSRTVDVPLYGRTWRFDIRSNRLFRDAVDLGQPALVLAGGLVIDLMLVGLFLGFTRTNRALHRIADMNAALERKASELTDTNRDLERFACIVSHDLKTPLRGIGDLAWYLEEDLAPYLASPEAAPDVGYNIARLHTQVRRMNALIEGILDYSAAGNRTMRIERVDTAEVLAEIADGLDVHERQLVLDGEMPTLETCRTRFEQVLNNIVGNAFKYHPERDRAIVTVRVTRLDEHYRFSIADNGPGIDPRFHERIFEMFQTLQTQDAMESTGIGLAIVRKSLDSVGGRVRVDSEPGRGTTFHIDWPVRTSTDGPEPAESGRSVERKAA